MKKWLLAIGAVVAVAAVGVGAVMAQTPGTGSGTSFLDRVAQKLGIDTPKLQNAIQGARSDQLDEAVKNGDLTQKQADALKQRFDQALNNGDFPGLGGMGFMHQRGPFGKGVGPGFNLKSAADQLAGFLGISQAQLQTELSANNATLASVAQAHGKSRDQLKTFITNTAKSAFDTAVKNGDITQKQEDNALSELNSHLDQLVDSKFFSAAGRGFRFGPHGHGPGVNPNGNAPTPGASEHGMGMMEGLFRS